MRRDDDYVGRQVMEMNVEGARRRGRLKFRWKDKVKEDLQEKGMREDQVRDRNGWKRLALNSDPI